MTNYQITYSFPQLHIEAKNVWPFPTREAAQAHAVETANLLGACGSIVTFKVRKSRKHEVSEK